MAEALTPKNGIHLLGGSQTAHTEDFLGKCSWRKILIMNDYLKSPVFQCRQCGDCCAGRGGILVKPYEVEAMAALLGLSVAEFNQSFVEDSALGPRLTAADGVCVFLMPGGLCRVHAVKPFICRQWPFLPAILMDPDELENAKTACPGLNPDCRHDDFVEAALRPGEEKDG